MLTVCQSERGRGDTATIRARSAALRSSTLKSALKSVEELFAHSEGITVEQQRAGGAELKAG